MKRIALLLTVGVIAGTLVLPATTAEAARFAGATTCRVELPEWPTTGDNFPARDCSGTSTGLDVTNPTSPQRRVLEAFSLKIERYNESCLLNLVPPPIGNADGTITTPAMGHFEWVRVGLDLVFVPVVEGAQSAGIAKFIPTPPLGDCLQPKPLNVTIAGLEFGAI